MLEAAMYEDNAFVTLTYSDDFAPENGSLVPKHAQDWLKRLRSAIAPMRVRYYLVGEYGDATQRPHYHVVLFGFPLCERGQSRFDRRTDRCCRICDLVRDTWGMGNVLIGSVGVHSAQYCAGYTVKKMTRHDDPRLDGRHPEFCRMSLRPGIGADAMHEIASELMRLGLDDSQADVPSALRHGSRLLPLGRYLRRRLRKMVGKDEKAPQATLDKLASEVFDLYEAAKRSAPTSEAREVMFRNLLLDEEAQKVASMEARAKIFNQRRSI